MTEQMDLFSIGGALIEECPFCAIVAGQAPAEIVMEYPGAIALVPLNPVTPGHLIVIPRLHVPHAAYDPNVTGSVMMVAALVAQRYESYNLITSVGSMATQTVSHLHVHVVPRREGDGLVLPWSK